MPHHVRTCSRSILRISIVKADPKREQLLSLDWQHLAALENSAVRAPFQLLNLILDGETLRVAHLGLQTCRMKWHACRTSGRAREQWTCLPFFSVTQTSNHYNVVITTNNLR